MFYIWKDLGRIGIDKSFFRTNSIKMKLTYLYFGTGRELIKIVKPLFYKKIIDEILKEDYVSKITLDWKKLKKINWKKITFKTEKPEELKKYLEKFDKFEKII